MPKVTPAKTKTYGKRVAAPTPRSSNSAGDGDDDLSQNSDTDPVPDYPTPKSITNAADTGAAKQSLKRRPAVAAAAATKATPKANLPTETPAVSALVPEIDHGLDRSLVLEIILAKLASSKSCDWHQVSLDLAKDGKGRKAKGKKGEEGLSGMELHDLYHNIILPSLKAGRALWTTEIPPTGASEQDVGMLTPVSNLDEYEYEYESEEGDEWIPEVKVASTSGESKGGVARSGRGGARRA